MANERERERTKSLNQALEILRDILPVPEAEKRSKIQTLRMAKDYIEFLDIYMRTSQPPATHRGFAESGSNSKGSECTQSIQTNNHFDNNNESGSNSEGSECARPIQHIHQFDKNNKTYQLPTNGTSQLSTAQAGQPDSPLTYKFYKFRLKSQNKNDS